ncbi:MAG: translation elongation factor-like protein [Promethearchaeota archaeon]
MKKVGVVDKYYSKISVALVTLSDNLAVDDKIRIKGATTDFEQVVKSMQIEHESINSAKKGQMIGLKVENRVRPKDEVFILE